MISALGVLGLDDLTPGGGYLKRCCRAHSGDAVRLALGSQIVWPEPSDNKIQYWTDGDLVNEDGSIGRGELAPHSLSQAGPRITPDFLR